MFPLQLQTCKHQFVFNFCNQLLMGSCRFQSVIIVFSAFVFPRRKVRCSKTWPSTQPFSYFFFFNLSGILSNIFTRWNSAGWLKELNNWGKAARELVGGNSWLAQSWAELCSSTATQDLDRLAQSSVSRGANTANPDR